MGAVEEIILSGGPGETRLALMAGGHPVEFVIDRGDVAPGDVLLGRVLSVNRALHAAFVEIGAPDPGFLNPAGGVTEGQTVVVQVSAAARAGKGAELTLAVSLTGPLLAYTPARSGLSVSRKLEEPTRERLRGLLKPVLGSDEGVVLRTAAADAEPEALLAELEQARQRWQAIQATQSAALAPARLEAPSAVGRLLADYPNAAVTVEDATHLALIRPLAPQARIVPDAFAEQAEDDLDAALQPRLALPGGGALIIEAAAALTVIDIDSGGGPPLDANLRAIPEIARQLRLRALAGHILVDLIPLRDRRALGRFIEALREAVADDPTPTHVVGTTPLGLVEMTRERRRPPLAETLLEPPGASGPSAETVGLAGLRDLLRETLARPGARLGLAVSPAVATALRRRPAALADAARRLGRPLPLREDPTLTGYAIEAPR